MKRFLATAALLAMTAPLAAQDFIPGVFPSYAEMSRTMDEAMKAADITRALMRFDGGVTSAGQALDVQRQFRKLFPNGLPHTAMLRKDMYLNGFWRELRVYWHGTTYLYVSILVHDRGNEVVAIEFSTNTDYDTIAGQF